VCVAADHADRRAFDKASERIDWSGPGAEDRPAGDYGLLVSPAPLYRNLQHEPVLLEKPAFCPSSEGSPLPASTPACAICPARRGTIQADKKREDGIGEPETILIISRPPLHMAPIRSPDRASLSRSRRRGASPLSCSRHPRNPTHCLGNAGNSRADQVCP